MADISTFCISLKCFFIFSLSTGIVEYKQIALLCKRKLWHPLLSKAENDIHSVNVSLLQGQQLLVMEAHNLAGHCFQLKTHLNYGFESVILAFPQVVFLLPS